MFYSRGITWISSLLPVFLLCLNAETAANCGYDALKGNSSWLLGLGWTSQGSGTNTVLAVENTGDTFAWLRNRVVDGSWRATVDVNFKKLLRNGGETGTASVAFTFDHSAPSVRLLVDLSLTREGYIRLGSDYLESGIWRKIYEDASWRRSTGSVFRLAVERVATNDYLQVTVESDSGRIANIRTSRMPSSFLDRVSGFGVRTVGAAVEFNGIELESPVVNTNSAEQTFTSMARCVTADLLGHFWEGEFASGKIQNTWGGYSGNLPDARGGIWERGTLIFLFDGLERATGDQRVRSRIASDWKYISQAFRPEELESCGANTINPACDDAGWAALTYLAAYRATADTNALVRAENLVMNAFERWKDGNFGGGMWYRDARDIKSLYQAGLITAALRISDLTGNALLLSNAVECADWIESKLLRSDGLYWCDYNSAGPVGEERPYDINEAGSVTFLAGNMAMGVIHAWRFRHSGDEIHRTRAIRTATAIYNYLVRAKVFVNDRDAWTNGTFICDWVSEVLTLEGVGSKHWQAIRSTAASIYSKARTTNHYYGGSWSGPAEGGGSRWWQVGSRPEQIMTSATSGMMVIAAALLEQQSLSAYRPTLRAESLASSASISIKLHGQVGWSYAIESSSDLKEWSFENIILLSAPSAVFKPDGVADQSARFYRARISFDP